jgi:hypothetical protein
VRDVFAAIEGQLELLRSDLASLQELREASVLEGLRMAIEQLDQILLRLKRYREGSAGDLH